MNNLKIYEMTMDGFLEQESKYKYMQMDHVGDLFVQRKPYSVQDGIARIHVFGPLKKYVSKFESESGFTSYEQLQNELDLAESDPSVISVIMRFDSPGGESQGSEEIARQIQTFTKPIYGVVDGIAASAAYKLLAATTEILTTTSSEVGSIGSIMVIQQNKETLNSMGINNLVIYNEGATLKSIGHDFGDVSPEQLEYLQNKINKSGERFQALVKEFRPEINELVFNAGMYNGQEAIDLGLIDYSSFYC